MCPLSHSYLYCYRFIVIHQSGTRKALFGPGLNNTKVYLNSFVVLLNIIQLQDKVCFICYLDFRGKYNKCDCLFLASTVEGSNTFSLIAMKVNWLTVRHIKENNVQGLDSLNSKQHYQ